MRVSVTHPELGAVDQVAPPFVLSRTPARIRTAPPLLGEDSDAVLAELGYSVEAFHSAQFSFNGLHAALLHSSPFGRLITTTNPNTPADTRAGVVGGSYFEVMGLRPVLGRLLDSRDDGPSATGAAVLTYRFWSHDLHSDPNVLNKSIRLGERQRR